MVPSSRRRTIAWQVGVIATTLSATPVFADAVSECIAVRTITAITADRFITACSEVIHGDPGAAWAYANRSIPYYVKGDYDKSIADSNEAMRLGLKGAGVFYNRAVSYHSKREYDRAIGDFNEAIRLNPKYVQAYYNRGNSYFAKGEYDRASADYSEAIQLNPQFGGAYYNRGVVYRVKGANDTAIADFNEAIRLEPENLVARISRGIANFYRGDFTAAAADLLRYSGKSGPYTMLWRYLARERSGIRANDELAANAAQLDPKNWPYPVIDFYLGRRPVDEMMSAAANPVERCQAGFYLGEWHLLKSNHTEAAALLRQAEATCPKDYVEYAGAVAELERLVPHP